MADIVKNVNPKAQKELSESKLTILSSILSIVVGLLIGLIFLFVIEAIKAESNFGYTFIGFNNLVTAGFSSVTRFTKVLYNTAPLMMCGLAVGFAFKAGLFNIGVSGQYTIGGFFALIAGIIWGLPWWLCILVAMVAGALWAFIPGLFKAIFNINEVITTIMLNWAGLFFANLLFYNIDGIYTSPERTVRLSSVNPSALLPDFGLSEVSSYINIGIILAILFAIATYVLLEKTIFGFEVKACGSNKNASTYAGIKAKKTIVYTMLISGGLAGIGGALTYLSGNVEFTVTTTTLAAVGFNGIPVALLAYSNPIGIIFSSLLISYLQVGGEAMQPIYSSEMVNLITSVIIYFSAFALIVNHFLRKHLNRKKEDGENLIQEEELENEVKEELKEVEKTNPEEEKPKVKVKKPKAKPVKKEANK